MNVNFIEFRYGLLELADKNEQIRLWAHADNDTGEFSSLEEVRSSVFNVDVQKNLDNKKASFSLSEDVILMLKDLRAKIDGLPEELSPMEIIEHPSMQQVREISQKIIKHLVASLALEKNTGN